MVDGGGRDRDRGDGGVGIGGVSGDVFLHGGFGWKAINEALSVWCFNGTVIGVDLSFCAKSVCVFLLSSQGLIDTFRPPDRNLWLISL